jgi:hypothetical protein
MTRKDITKAQKKALRDWYRGQYPKPSQRACILWFAGQYNQRISQSTVSSLLSTQYRYLDEISPTSRELDTLRQRQPQWPQLEEILYKWQQLIEARGGLVTGDLLSEKAREIWVRIPEYQNKPVPEFSSGWVQRFKQRHALSHRQTHGEASSVPHSASEEMAAVRAICDSYQEEDIYNFDETGLYWRASPSAGLTSRVTPGVKKDKSRISILACTNATGSDRFPLWFIGRAKQPRALRSTNLAALRAVYRGNTKAWNNNIVMAEWLGAFYNHISNRRVLLLMDNFSAHLLAVHTTPPPPNIRIQWLPAESTSVFQPLDQGILQNLKHYYKKNWLRFMLREYESGQDPIKTVTLHQALCWSLSAWNDEITSSTIYSCFRKSTVIDGRSLKLPEQPVSGIQQLYQAVRTAGQIQDAMDISQFLNPAEEDATPYNEEDEAQDPLDTLLLEMDSSYTADDDELPEAEPYKPTPHEAHTAVQQLLLYQTQQSDAQPDDIKVLRRLERCILAAMVPSRQSTLTGFLLT